MAEQPVRWGVLGCAGIARRRVIPALLEAEAAELVAVASRSMEKAPSTADQVSVPSAYGPYRDLLADPNVEAVYVPLPNHLHKPWSIRSNRQIPTSSK